MPDQQKPTAKKHLSLILRVSVAVLACWLIAREMNFGEIGGLFLNSWLVLFLAAFIFIVCQILISLRWWIFMKAWGIQIGCWTAVKLTFLGLYFNNFLPGAVGGDFVRGWYASQYTDRRMASFISVFVDRIFALLGTVIMAVSAILIAGQKGMFARKEKTGVFLALSESKWILLSVGAAGVLLLVAVVVIPAGRRLLKTFTEKALHYGKKAFEQGVEAWTVLVKKPYVLLESLLITFVLQSMVVLSLWLIGQQMGIPTELKMYFVFFPIMWVVGAIPVSIAGIGIMEGGLIVLFMQFGGVPMELKSTLGALVLSQRAVWLLASLPGLAVYLSGQHMPKDILGQFSIDEKKAIQ